MLNETKSLAHQDLLLANELVYKPLGVAIENFKKEDESAEYGACKFTIGNCSVQFRTGKITQTKVGQFITFWKRIGKGPIMPYHIKDSFDFLIVSVRAENQFGQFIFPKAVLFEKGIVSSNQKEGKRAMRVYPPWDKTRNLQANKTQIWQLQYFIQLSVHDFDFAHMEYLLSLAD